MKEETKNLSYSASGALHTPWWRFQKHTAWTLGC